MDGIVYWFMQPLKRYAEFSGRTRRKEYWTFYIGIVIINAILSIVMQATDNSTLVTILAAIVGIAVIVPMLAAGIRRMHDIGKSGWNILFGLIPLVGSILLLIWFLKDSQPGTNQYGPNPKA